MVGASKAERRSGPIRYGMVGGGEGAFIGGVHRIAARLDNEFVLVAGALSSDPERARASALELRLDSQRSYGSFAEMARAEAQRPDGIEAVAIVTPNNVHFPAAGRPSPNRRAALSRRQFDDVRSPAGVIHIRWFLLERA